MSKILSYNYTGKSLVMVYQDPTKGVQQAIVDNSHANWLSILEAYKKGKVDDIIPMLSVASCITSKSDGKLTFTNGKFYFQGQETSNYLFEKMISYVREIPSEFERLMLFAKNLYQNESPKARDQLYKFLEQGNMPITKDGCFLAYKGVDEDFWSKTAGSLVPIIGKKKGSEGAYFLYNGIGERLKVDRKLVDPNANVHCSKGLHVGTHHYADGFKGSGRLVIVKVNPRDACAVPEDGNEKLRCCEYEVIAEYGKKLNEKRDHNFDRAAKIRYHNRRDAKGHFIPANAPHRDANGRFVSAS